MTANGAPPDRDRLVRFMRDLPFNFPTSRRPAPGEGQPQPSGSGPNQQAGSKRSAPACWFGEHL